MLVKEKNTDKIIIYSPDTEDENLSFFQCLNSLNINYT